MRARSSRIALTLGLFILTLLSDSTAAQAGTDSGCRSYADIPVFVTPVFGETRFDTSLDLARLQSLANHEANVTPHYDTLTLGLASYTSLMQFQIPILHQRLPDGSYCARVQSLSARIGYDPITVYVANEFQKGTCAFQAVLSHEQKHIDVNRALLNEYGPKIQSRLAAFLKTQGMFIVPNKDYADKLLRERVKKIVSDLTKEMMEENKRRQKLIDTPQEYAKNNTVCQGAVARVADNFRRKR